MAPTSNGKRAAAEEIVASRAWHLAPTHTPAMSWKRALATLLRFQAGSMAK